MVFSVPGVSGYENLIGAASVKITDAGTQAVLAEANFRPRAGIFLSVDNTNAGIGIGSFAVPDQSSSSFPGEPVYPLGIEGQRGSFTYDLQSKINVSGVGISCVGFPVLICGAPKALPTSAGNLILYQTPNVCCQASAVFTAQLQRLTAFSAFTARAGISPRSFDGSGSFTLGNCSNGINPQTEIVTLRVGNYSVAIPSGSFVRTTRGAYVYETTISGVALEIRITPVSATSYSFKAEGRGANLTGTTNPVTVWLTIWDDAGTTSVTRAFADPRWLGSWQPEAFMEGRPSTGMSV